MRPTQCDLCKDLFDTTPMLREEAILVATVDGKAAATSFVDDHLRDRHVEEGHEQLLLQPVISGSGIMTEMNEGALDMRSVRLDAEMARNDGTHIWLMMCSYRISEETATKSVNPDIDSEMNLDTESLVMVTGPICYRCAQPYTTDPCWGNQREERR